MKKHSPFTFLCLLLLATTACRQDQRTSGVLDANTMTEVLTDLYLLEGYYAIESQYRFDSMSPELLSACDTLLEKHHVTRENVEKSFDYYSQHPEEYKSIQEDVAARLEQLNTSDEALPQE